MRGDTRTATALRHPSAARAPGDRPALRGRLPAARPDVVCDACSALVPPGRGLVEVAVLADAALALAGLLIVLSAAAAPTPAADWPGGDLREMPRGR